MEIVAVLILAALVFGVCFLVDKGFTKLFRSQSQHHSGKALRLNKRYGSFGLIAFVFGLGMLFVGLTEGWLLLTAGIMLIVVGVGLVVYYMTFGVFYDDEGFLLTTFGKKSKAYRYQDIEGQMLYITTGRNVMVELYLKDGRTFQVQLTMVGAAEYLDYAFDRWLCQTGKTREECEFHDPENSCWFPTVEA